MSYPEEGERRVSQDEQLGYIRGKVEALQDGLAEFKEDVSLAMKSQQDTLANHTGREEDRLSALEDHAVQNSEHIRDIKHAMDIQANTHKYIWMTIKAIGVGVFAALTMKLGDILLLIKMWLK